MTAPKRDHEGILQDNDAELAQGTSVENPSSGCFWGWVVCGAACVTMVILDGMMFSFGVIFVDLLEYFKCSKGQAAMVGSALMGTHLLAGPITSALVNVWGVRIVTMIGSIIATGAFGCCIFSRNITELTLLYGVLGGVGVSMVYLPSILAVGFYFEKRRALANGITQSGSGFGAFLYAPLTEYLLSLYGWRGTMLVLSGISLHCLACGALYRPLKIRFERETSQEPFDEHEFCKSVVNEKLAQTGNVHATAAVNGKPAQSVAQILLLKESKSYMWDLSQTGPTTSRSLPNSPFSKRRPGADDGNLTLTENDSSTALTTGNDLTNRRLSTSRGSLVTSTKPIKLLYKKDAFYSGSLLRLPEYRANKSASLYSLPRKEIDAMDRPDGVNEALGTKIRRPRENHLQQITSMLKRMMGLSLLSNSKFLLCMTSMVLWTTHSTVLTLLPICAISRGVSRVRAAYLLSIIGGSNTAARILAGWISDRPNYNCLHVNMAALVVGGITCISIAFTSAFELFAFESSVFGLCMGTWTSLRPIILVDCLGLENLTNAFGLVAMFQGAAFLIGPPLAGVLYVSLESYLGLFVMAGCAFISSGVVCFFLLGKPTCRKKH